MSGIEKVNAGKLQTGAFRRNVTQTWWTEIPFYCLYMLREATAIFMLVYTINLIVGLGALASGEDAFVAWANFQKQGGLMWLAVISFCMAMYHTATWFAATPKVMPLQIGDKKVPANLIIAAHWGAFFAIALVIFALAGLK